MKVDIAQSIREVLDERQVVSIDGLGSLKLVNTPASFGELRKSILPPGVELVFEESTSSNTPLIENICLKYGISPKKADKFIQKFSETLLNTLANFGKVHILGVGSIVRTSAGEINIIQDEDFIGQYYKGLPEIPIRLAPKKKQDLSTPIIQDITREEETSIETPEAGIPDTIAGESDQEPIVSDHSTRIDKTEVKPAAIIPGDVPGSVTSQHEDELKYLKTNRERGIWWPLFWIVVFILLLFLLLKTCGVFSDSDDGTIQQENITDPITLAEQNPNFSPDTLEDFEGSLILPDQCIIITGVFSSGANITRMDERLRNEGYTVYHEEFGPYTRVGLIFDCDGNTDLEAFIQDIRGRISAKAWYLDPAYYVEY